MRIKSIIVDNFYDDPEEVRNLALNQQFVMEGTYPGLDSKHSSWTPEIIQKFSSVMNAPISAHSIGCFRLSLEGNTASRHIHFDPGFYVATVCLSYNEHCKGGTSFWRHNETGLEIIDYFDLEKIKEQGFKSPKDLEEKLVREQGTQEHLFTKTDEAPFAFNRCVILDGNYLHSPTTQGWGDCPENGRLTQHFFFKVLGK